MKNQRDGMMRVNQGAMIEYLREQLSNAHHEAAKWRGAYHVVKADLDKLSSDQQNSGQGDGPDTDVHTDDRAVSPRPDNREGTESVTEGE